MKSMMKVEKRKPNTLTKAERLEELRLTVSLCFTMLDGDDTLSGLVPMTGLSKTTIYRLWRGQVTLAVHFGTIQALGYAVGLRLTMTESGVKISLAE